jgi:hypothetical protein
MTAVGCHVLNNIYFYNCIVSCMADIFKNKFLVSFPKNVGYFILGICCTWVFNKNGQNC